jgi:hypothetical protein
MCGVFDRVYDSVAMWARTLREKPTAAVCPEVPDQAALVPQMVYELVLAAIASGRVPGAEATIETMRPVRPMAWDVACRAAVFMMDPAERQA